MSVEQVARDFIAMMSDVEGTKSKITPDAVVSGGVLPAPMPALEAINIIGGLKAAFPDLKFDVQQVTVNGDQATVKAQWGATNTGSLSLPLPGMPTRAIRGTSRRCRWVRCAEGAARSTSRSRSGS